MKKNVLLIIIFIILSLSSVAILNHLKNDTVDAHLNGITNNYLNNYNVLRHEHSILSNVVYKTNINTDKILSIFKDASLTSGDEQTLVRERLYQELKSTYNLLKEHHIKQLHFHLPNNESFLRFHKPETYGDDLTGIRETVEYVNRTKKPIDGFEMGRFKNGIRFVFPLFYNDKYIGSVEISYTSLAISLEFIDDYKIFTNFLLLKEHVYKKVWQSEKKNYVPSQFENFYIEKGMLKKLQEITNKTKVKLSNKTKDIFNTKWKDESAFSIYDANLKEIITFIKINNPVSKKTVALFILRSDDSYIERTSSKYSILFIFSTIFIAILLFSLYKEINYRNLIELNNKNLKERVDLEVEANRKKDEKLIQQSRLAQIGEMISMIAHQWRQPLGAISSTVIGIQTKLARGKYDLDNKEQREEFLELINKSHGNITEYVAFLSNTIDDFRNFFKPDKAKELVPLTTPIKRALQIVENSLSSKNIEISYSFECQDETLMYQNEMMQVVLNLLKNAEDNFIEKDTQNRYIKITTQKQDNNYIITVYDNGGGIDEDIITKIFDPYFSTKNEKNGTGLGLYMSKILIEEHHNGSLVVKNIDDGVRFKIILPRNTNV